MGIISTTLLPRSVALAVITLAQVTAIAGGCAQHKQVLKKHDIFNLHVDFAENRVSGSFEADRFEITETQPGAFLEGSPPECMTKMESTAVEWAKGQGLEVSRRELAVGTLTLHIKYRESPTYFELVYTHDEPARSGLSMRVIAAEGTALEAAAYAGRYDVRTLCRALLKTIRCGKSRPRQ